ncbi:MAG: hypothetical protein Q9191_001028 [Dirinaria sp. TL-2023a]
MPRDVARHFRLYRCTLVQLLRTLGLDIVSFFARKFRPNHFEQAEIAISDSIWIIISHGTIHLLPVAVSIYLITLNLKGHYIGQHLPWSKDDYGDNVALAFIQIAAKVQELLVIASIAVVILHTTIDALTNDHGLPLGLSTSGFSFTRISYFWSPAFWGGTFKLCSSPNQRLIVIYALTVLGGIVGLTVGPASAVLMLPRTATWQQFATTFWMNGTADDFWPGVLRAEHLGESSSRNKTCSDGFVPGIYAQSGLPLLLTYDFYNRNNSGGFQIFTANSSFPRIIDGTPKVKDISAESWTIAPHVATSRALTRLWKDPHWAAKGNPTGTPSGQTSSGAAVVRTVCSPHIMLTRNGTSEVSLPDLPAFETWTKDGRPGDVRTIKLRKPLWVQMNSTRAGNDYLTTVFVAPDPDMVSVTTGVVVLGPLTKQSRRIAMTCSIDARWNHAQHSMIKSNDDGIGNVGNSVFVVLRGRSAQADLKNMSLPVDDGSWRHVSADETWLNGALGYQTQFNTRFQPYFKGVDRRGYTTTALATFILARSMYTEPKRTSTKIWRDSVSAMESVIATAFADVMSRTGSVREISRDIMQLDSVDDCQKEAGTEKYQFCPPPSPSEAKTLSELHFNGSTTGYAYQASSATDYLSISVLGLYVVIVLSHIVSSTISRRSFACWDTFEEMLLLAKNSQPSFNCQTGFIDQNATSRDSAFQSASACRSSGNSKQRNTEKATPATEVSPLANTSSGIQSFSTMKLRLRIRAMPTLSHTAASDHSSLAKEHDKIIATEEVQLIVEDDEPSSMENLIPGRAYGMRR